MPTIFGANTADPAYEISNSLRIGPAANSTTPHVNLRRTLGSAGTEETFTFSCWVKLSAKLEYNFWLLAGSQESSSPNHYTFFRISDDARLKFVDSGVGTATNIEFGTRLRDPSAWYHAMIAVDTTQSTASDRVKMYLNGNQETLVSNAYPDQNHGYRVLENGVTQTIGTWIADDGTAYACDDGYISEAYLIDGQQLAPTEFGKTNSNGVWVPKDYTGTYGTHGFRFEFKQTGSSANSSGIGADTSGNDNHFSVNNSAATDVTVDTPTNNFCTLNLLDKTSGITTSEGNTKGTANSNHSAIRSTIGLNSGKWYWENKILSIGSGPAVGVMTTDARLTDQLNATDQSRWYRNSGAKFNNSSETGSYGASYTTNDIIGIALNLDDGEITFYKNGSSQGVAFTDLLSSTDESWLPAIKLYNEAIDVNFGNPSFSISSGNADANGYGNFEYAVPSGYYSICTKNLAEYG